MSGSAATSRPWTQRRRRIVEDTARTVLATVPELDDPDLQRDVTDLAGECLRSIGAVAVLPAETWVEPGIPPAGLDLARALARRGNDVTVVFDIFRRGHFFFWAEIMRVAQAEIDDDQLRTRVLDVMWERLGRWMDYVVNRLVDVHQSERERSLRGALARRTELVEAILGGSEVNIEHAESVLAHDLRIHQTAFAIRAADRRRSPISLLEGLANQIATTLGAARAFTITSGSQGLWGWIATPAVPDRSLLRSRVGDPAATVTVGRPGPGLVGFRVSHREAVRAQRVVAAAPAAPPLTLYEDVELVALLSADDEAMRAFVQAELGALAVRSPSNERLCQTTLAYLQYDRNATAASRALGVHRNTVTNRLARTERLLGRSVHTERVRLELALMLVAGPATS
jgi:hypothetical protein